MGTAVTEGQHANPLTLWVPVKQGFVPQFLVKELLNRLANGGLITDPGNFLHFARFTGIPNVSGNGIMGILLVTDFDGPMTPYLDYFYQHAALRAAFASLYLVAEHAPVFPETQAVFEQYLNANNLSPIGSLSFAYNASVAQIVAAFPPTADGNHANPLTLWIPVKQDAVTQSKVTQLLTALKGGTLITGDSNLLHYVRTVGIPNVTGGNLGILIVTEFDGAMNPYLDYFYTLPNIQAAFAAIYDIALNPPQLPNNQSNFEQYINAHNLAATTSISYAYRATVAQIVAHFPPTP